MQTIRARIGQAIPPSWIRTLPLMLLNSTVARWAAWYLERYATFFRWRTYLSGRPGPEWFDHRVDQYRWTRHRTPIYWVERGVYPRELMTEGCRVLDICCGDGFYPYHFFADVASQVDAIDRDPDAILHAQEHYPHPRLRISTVDVVGDPFPDSAYDVVTWDGAIEHFSDTDVRTVLGKVAEAMTPAGVLSGYTPLVEGQPDSDNPYHSHDFSSAAEMVSLLREFFPHVATFETTYPDRRNLYFRAAHEASRLGRFDVAA